MTRARLVLASSSPRRAALLAGAGHVFEVASPAVDESLPPLTDATHAVLMLSARKAAAVEAPGAWVVAADTLGALDGALLGKPVDEAHARAMLRSLSGRAHEVLTGVAVRAPGGLVRQGLARSLVTFRALGDEEIDAYVATGEPLDKAGAYAIQGGGAAFVARVEGPWDNVVGLPMDVVARLLREASFPRA